jgi:hypothetical protein
VSEHHALWAFTSSIVHACQYVTDTARDVHLGKWQLITYSQTVPQARLPPIMVAGKDTSQTAGFLGLFFDQAYHPPHSNTLPQPAVFEPHALCGCSSHFTTLSPSTFHPPPSTLQERYVEAYQARVTGFWQSVVKPNEPSITLDLYKHARSVVSKQCLPPPTFCPISPHVWGVRAGGEGGGRGGEGGQGGGQA